MRVGRALRGFLNEWLPRVIWALLLLMVIWGVLIQIIRRQ